jgi:hypothetical protein
MITSLSRLLTVSPSGASGLNPWHHAGSGPPVVGSLLVGSSSVVPLVGSPLVPVGVVDVDVGVVVASPVSVSASVVFGVVVVESSPRRS